jgi:hypothetical protein
MNFIAPYMLWGAAAASIPVILHFFYRSRYRKLPWAAMKFLLTSIEQTSRRVRFQELLLLLARISVLVLLAMALARPSTSAGRASGRGDAVDAVFVIDNSMSMDVREGPTTRLDQARKAALAVLDQLPAHSTVQVIACSNRSTKLGPNSPSNLDQAKEIIQGITLTHQATDFLPSFKDAADALQRGHSPNKELYLFSDMQRLGWEQQFAPTIAAMKEIGKGATVYLVRCGNRPPKNVSVVDIVPQDGVPHTGERAGFAVLVRNSGSEPMRDLRVSLSVDGAKTKETQAINEVGPGETVPVPVTVKLDKPGLRVLTAVVQADELDADNRIDRVIYVRDQVRVLVIDGSPDEQHPERSASFFLMHALAPVREGERTRFHIQPRMVPAGHTAGALLAGQDVVILANVSLQPGGPKKAESLPGDFVRQLSNWVKQGHGVIIFSGDNVQPKVYNETLLKRDLLPLPLVELPPAATDKPINLDRKSFGSAFFSKFQNDENYDGFNKVEVYKHIGIEEPVAEKKSAAVVAQDKPEDLASVLLRYSNGKPAMASKRIGTGEVIFVGTAMHPVWGSNGQIGWTDLPLRHGLVIPMLDVMLSHLLHGQTQNQNIRAGETIRWQPPEADAARAFALIAPNGHRTRLGQPTIDKGRAMVTATDTPTAGVYRIVPADDSPDKPNAGVPFAVVPDVRETDNLETMPDPEIDKHLGFQVIHLSATGDPTAFSGAERLKREWTMWLLMAVLGIALVETVLAWMCGRAW